MKWANFQAGDKRPQQVDGIGETKLTTRFKNENAGVERGDDVQERNPTFIENLLYFSFTS